MNQKCKSYGFFHNGIPFNRYGSGARPILILQGLSFDNTPRANTPLIFYGFLKKDFTVYVLLRKPGLPIGYSLKDMADDYAAVIRQEFGAPVDVLGVSTGGSIALHLAADHPALVQRLIIHSSAHQLAEEADRMQLKIGAFARQGEWIHAYTELVSFMNPPHGPLRIIGGVLIRIVPWLMAKKPPKYSTDVAVEVEAESQHHFKNRLVEITAPTLVVAGALDPFYTPALFRETAQGIPNAKLILYPKMRHPALGRQFARDVLYFLNSEQVE